MSRNLKFLGLALVAVLAMSSVAASMASADALKSEKEGTALTLTGAQEGTDVFKVDGGEVKCTTVKYSGTATTPTNTVTVTPSYSGCTFAGLASTIDMNGCKYLVHISTTAGDTSGTVDITGCESGKEITVTAPGIGTPKCIVHVPAQNGLGAGSGANIGATTTREIKLTLNLTGIKYNQTAGTAETGNCATADSTTNGTYTGKAVVTAAAAGAHVGIFLV